MLDKGAVLRDALLGQPSVRAYLNETGLLQHRAPLGPLTCSSELHYDGSASDKGDSTTEVDIGRGQIVKTLVVAAGVVVVDELGQALFELTREVVVCRGGFGFSSSGGSARFYLGHGVIGLAPALHHAMLLECQAGDALAAVQWSNQMDFELSGSQKEIRAAVTALCARFGNEYWHRCDEKSSYPEEFVKTLSEAGWQR